MHKMYFDPDAFEHIRESISANPCPHRPYSLAVADSFALYMLLQLYVKGDRREEQRVMFDELRRAIAKSEYGRASKEKDIAYLLDVLQCADMITFEVREGEVFYRITDCVPQKLNASGEPRSLVMIKKCNRHVLEDYPSNVPFALYCLLCSLRRRDDGISYKIRISLKGISKRLKIWHGTASKSMRFLEKDGYVWTIYGNQYTTDTGQTQNETHQYVVYDHDHRKPPEKNELFRLRREQWKAKKGG